MPIKMNIDVATRLRHNLKKFPVERKWCDSILISSNLILLHSNDFLDQALIEKGVFTPRYAEGYIIDAISETVMIIEMSLNNRRLKIEYNK